jgi:arabinofuranosyltransferase
MPGHDWPYAPKFIGRRTVGLAVSVVSTVALLLLVFRDVWVGEDTFITFRTIDQFVHGAGLRWNPDERVQSYTHPLWMLSNIPLYWLIREICTTVTVTALACTAATWLVIANRFRRRPGLLLLAVFLPLAASRSFLLYSSSGFENALSHLCYAVFAVLFLSAADRDEVPWGRLALAAALGMTNRLDTALVYAPPLLFLVLVHRRGIRWSRLLAGFAPVLGWLLFSTFYYGFPLPNTALAKLPAGIPRRVLVDHGVSYVAKLLVLDPVGFVVIVAGAAVTLGGLVGIVRDREDPRPRALASLGLGLLLYCAWVVFMGGCYLAGRYWSLPIVGSVILGAAALEGANLRRPAAWLFAAVVVGVAVVLLHLEPRLQRASWARRHPITPEDVAFKYLGSDFEWRSSKLASRFQRGAERLRDGGTRVTLSSIIGISGFAAGRDVVVVDRIGLADPLLARLPARPLRERDRQKMGHFSREVPDGYVHARETGSLEEMDPNLREYYRPLRSIVSDPLFDPGRLRNLVAFNLGRYDHWRAAYLEAKGPPRPKKTFGERRRAR